MSTFSLIWANLFRNPTRTSLTVLSVVVAFMLFMLLRAIAAAFAGGVDLAGVDRLVVSGKYSAIDSLPISHVRQIQAIEGVDLATHQHWFGGIYQDPRKFFPKHPVPPETYFEVFDELIIEPDVLARFAATRVGALATVSLAERFGWKPGDIIPILGDIWVKEDGSRLWEFELVGTYAYPPERSGGDEFLLQYEYFTESVIDHGKDAVGWITVRVSDTDRANEIAGTIDKLFENSADATRTATEDQFRRQFAAQLGDMGFITTMILTAVFFTIVLLTANTMTQALRERIPELAVLKTLGFTDSAVSLLVLGEALMLCLIGGVVGVILALFLEPGLNAQAVAFIGNFEMTPLTITSAIGLSVLVGLIVGAVPAVTAKRLTIVDALRQR